MVTIEMLQAARIALHKHGDRHVLTLRVRCESEEQAAQMVNGSDQKGRVYQTEWKGKKTFWAEWRGRPAGRILQPVMKELEGAQAERARLGVRYTATVAQQWKGHGVGQRISEEQKAERQAIVEMFEAILPQ